MGSFNGFILTNNGKKLLEEALTGKRLVFTKFQFGDGETTEDPKEVTELVNMSKETAINQIENNGNGQVMLRVIIDNKDIDTGYYIKEIGVFAKCDDGEEVLYAYNKAMKPDYLPVYNGINLVELEYQNYITIAQIEDVTAIIDENFTYLTKEEANEKFVRQTQIANESEKGILSLSDIRNTEIAYVLGNEYGGTFSEELTEVKSGKVYYYWYEAEKRYIPYLAIHNKTYTGGIAEPEISNFENMNISSNLFYRKLLIKNPALNGFYFVSAYVVGNLLFITAFITDPALLNKAAKEAKVIDLKMVIPELSGYTGSYDTVPSINLTIDSSFKLTKSYSAIDFYEGQHFCIINGIYK